MKGVKCLFVTVLILGMAGLVYAAPVGLGSEADATKAKWSYNDMLVSAGFIADIVDERGIDIPGGEFEMDVFAARLGLSVLERFNFYIDLGQAQDMKYSAEVNAQNVSVKYEYDDSFLWGIGANALIYRWDNGLEIGAGASYRQADLDIDQVTIENVQYSKSKLDSVRDGDYQEWQVACELAWRTDYFIPYIGVKYSDVEVDGDVTLSSVQYNASGKNSSEVVGAFLGCTITPKLAGMEKSEQIAINVEGRFIDEEAVNVGVTYKF